MEGPQGRDRRLRRRRRRNRRRRRRLQAAGGRLHRPLLPARQLCKCAAARGGLAAAETGRKQRAQPEPRPSAGRAPGQADQSGSSIGGTRAGRSGPVRTPAQLAGLPGAQSEACAICRSCLLSALQHATQAQAAEHPRRSCPTLKLAVAPPGAHQQPRGMQLKAWQVAAAVLLSGLALGVTPVTGARRSRRRRQRPLGSFCGTGCQRAASAAPVSLAVVWMGRCIDGVLRAGAASSAPPPRGLVAAAPRRAGAAGSAPHSPQVGPRSFCCGSCLLSTGCAPAPLLRCCSLQRHDGAAWPVVRLGLDDGAGSAASDAPAAGCNAERDF